MDILDVMDLLDVGHPLTSRSSPLLDDSDEMEPNNLSQSAGGMSETMTSDGGDAAPAAQAFTEPSLELKLPVLSSSSSESESEEPANAAAGTSTGVEGERAASPPPNCAICLGRCKNKCFTDSCMHQFCFKCLCEWSKVKPECPLCKQTFKSIIHNVKSIHQFEEYHVQPPTVQIAHPPFEMDIFDVVYPGHNRIQAWNGSTYRPYYFESSTFSTAAAGGSLPTASGSNANRSIPNSANGSALRNQYVYRGELLDIYRQEYPGGIANSGTLSQLWRRYVYDRKLYAMPVADITGRFRESSARFYRDNPSQIHRLMPWINRDIVCLLRQPQHDVTTVLESINSALTIMNILSPAFRRRLQPFLGTKTAHFIHELNNFARSPYDMIGYDRAVQYSPQRNNEEIVIEFTSSDESTDNDQIDVSGDGSNNNTTSSSSRTRSANAASINAINLTIHNRLTSSSTNSGGSRAGANNLGINSTGLSDLPDDLGLVIDLRGESDNNETTSTAQATNNSSNYLNGQNASASEGDMVTTGNQPVVAENIELTSGSSDECEFVLERKPPHLRTPEMVSLDSASDSDVVFVDESKALNKTSFSSSEGEFNEDPSGHKLHSRHHNKIAALVEAKKRNQTANLVKSEQQDSHTEVYNLGASTSAALRLSLQKQVDKSHRSNVGIKSKRLKRNKYCLRNTDSQSRTERQTPKSRGKLLDSESSHSSTSSSSTSSSSTPTSSSQSSSSSSDEDYMGSSTQRKKIISSAREEYVMRKRSHKIRKTKKRKASTSNSRRTAKRDTRKQKNNNYSTDDDDDDDEDENGHMGKNFALVMAINERRKRQNQKKFSNKSQENQQDESEGENSWRLKAVNEPLRKEQQQRAKSSQKSNERKRQHKTTTQQPQQQPTGSTNNRKRQKFENQQTQQVKETESAINFYNAENTSSDESDNINLIQLKTKLAGQDCHKQLNTSQEKETAVKSETETTTNNGNNSENDTNDAVTSIFTSSATTATRISATITENTTIPTAETTDATETLITSPSSAAVAATNETPANIEEAIIPRNDLFNFSDDSNDSIENNNDHEHLDNNNHDNVDQQHLHSPSSNNYQVNNQENSPHINNDDNANHNDHNAADDETLTNVPTSMNLNESNVFADGTSMSTTTTDTILHETAEQISSSAVNFYNPQQTFNTADFASEHSTNSSSDSSSTSSTTTGVLSSSGSSYINYESS